MKKINVHEILYFIAYALITISWYMTRVTFLSSHIYIFKYIAIGIFLFVCLTQSKTYKTKSFFKILLLIILGFLVYMYSKTDIVLIFILMLLALKNVDMNHLIKFDMYCKLLLIILLFILSYNDLTNEYIRFRDGILRFSFGFSHPNIFGFVCVNFWIDFIYLHKSKINWFYILLMGLTILFIDYYADSRSSGILLIIVLILSLLNQNKISKILENKIVKNIITNSWMIFSLLTMIGALLYYHNTDIGLYLDKLFSTRLGHIVTFYQNYHINLFGNDLILISTEEASLQGVRSAILDNAYSHYLLRFGIIFYLFISYEIKKLFKCSYHEKNYNLILILFVFLIYCLVENRLNKFVFVLFIGKFIYENTLSSKGEI